MQGRLLRVIKVADLFLSRVLMANDSRRRAARDRIHRAAVNLYLTFLTNCNARLTGVYAIGDLLPPVRPWSPG
jgi:hypothetical protein